MAGNPPDDRAFDRPLYITSEDYEEIEKAVSREPEVISALRDRLLAARSRNEVQR